MSELVKFLKSTPVKNRFEEIIGEKAEMFIASVIQAINTNKALLNATRESVINAAVTAALLDLPISPLGYAYIVPYKNEAQFQIGYKGLVQLALRTNEFLRINASDVREGELVSRNRLTGDIEFSWLSDDERANRRVIGYVSYFKLQNGFESTLYMTTTEVEVHAKKYSKNYNKYNSGVWAENFDAMAIKTVMKLNLAKNAPLSTSLQRAIEADQSVVIDNKDAGLTFKYVDNQSDGIEEAASKIAAIAGLDDDKKDEQVSPIEQRSLF